MLRPATLRPPSILLLLCLSASADSEAPPRYETHVDSAALFERMAPVFQSPRCMNCHTSAGYPRQGDDRHVHLMGVTRGPEDRGAAGLHCATCHREANQLASGVPGAHDWHLAPLRMAWEGLSAGQLCRALSDPARGGMSPAAFVDHFNTGLVRWAWAPGTDIHGRPRNLPPISHEEFVAVTKRWVASGAECPQS